MSGLAVHQVSYSVGEIPLAVGCSKRAAKAIVREIGRRVGGRRVVLVEDLLAYLRSKPKGSDKPHRAESVKLDAPNEFRIR